MNNGGNMKRNNRIRKIFVYIIVTLCMITLPSQFITAQPPLAIEPTVYEVCGVLPYHKMMARGWGTVIKLDHLVYIELGPAWQCPNCGMVMVTEGDLYAWGMDVIGKFATSYSPDTINANGCIIYGADYYGYTADNTLNGYKFFNS